MKGDPKILAQLNLLLANELTAMDQYFIHSRMFEDWGFGKLYERINHEMADETEHASRLIQRLLLLEGTPDMSRRAALDIGANVPEMLKSDLALEYQVVADLKTAIAVCETQQDYQTRAVLELLLGDTEEDHAYWLEQQLALISSVGLENYLQAQM